MNSWNLKEAVRRLLPWLPLVIFLSLILPAFYNREIHNDEAWIGQHVWSLSNTGKVESELFRDCPPLDREVVVYHKLLVWTGVVITKFVGWGIYQLRSISLICGLLCLLLISQWARREYGSTITLTLISVLCFAPIYWEQMLEFRPEALLLLLGFASFASIDRARKSDSVLLYALSGCLAGLAGLTHAFGIVFVFAGFIALLSEKRWIGGIIVLAAGLIAFSPYVAGYFTQRQLFLEQTIQNPLTTTSFESNWWQPFLNLLTEHKRILRKPEVIGLTIWTLISLFILGREYWRRRRFMILYLASLFIILAVSPLPKFTRYMIPLVPFMAVIVVEAWMALKNRVEIGKTALKMVFVSWGVVFFGYGTYALAAEVYPTNPSQVETNEKLAEHMTVSTLVMAPFDFLYMQRGNFTIQSWWGIDRAAHGHKSIEFLERYADSLGVEYLVADPVAMQAWSLTSDDLRERFARYELIYSIPSPERHLLKRRNDVVPR